MKIRIDREIPISVDIRPVIGETYEVIGTNNLSKGIVYTISVNGKNVSIFERECTLVEE